VPAAETTVLSCLASSLTASGSGLTSSNFSTCTLLSAGETPLTSRSAPLVVLVVATLTPEASSNGLKLAISAKLATGVWSAAAR